MFLKLIVTVCVKQNLFLSNEILSEIQFIKQVKVMV